MNTLAAYNSENADASRSPAAVLTFSERPPVSLATLQRDRIQFARADAIAISQALCLALVTALDRRRTNSDSDVTTETVFIDPASRLGVSVNEPGDEATAIQSVGRIMADIVPSDARPSLEKKIISKALASPPRFKTVRELSQALAGFEQLEGRELIQAVYERWEKGDVTGPVNPTDPRSSELKPTSTIRLGSQPKGLAVAVVGFALLVISVSGGIITATKNSTSSEIAPFLEARAIAPVPAGLVTWSVAGADRPALTTSSLSVINAQPPVPAGRRPAVAKIERRAPSPPSPVIARTEPSPTSPSIARSKSPVVVDLPPPQPGSDLPPTAPRLARTAGGDAPSASETNDVIRSTNRVATATAPPATEPVNHAPARSAAVNDPFARPVTYTARDADVSPPIPILPRLLASLQPSSPGVRDGALAIAVVVGEDGTAYSVSGINAPQNMGEYVLLTSALAAVKSWEFRPALKDGFPVRYRLIVPLREVTRSAP